MRKVPAQASGITERLVFRISNVHDIAQDWSPELRLLVIVNTLEDMEKLGRLNDSGVNNCIPLVSQTSLIDSSKSTEYVLADSAEIEEGDVVAVTPGRNYLNVLYRESDMHHTVFLTNQCNSHCLMCSQPPTPHDDSWLVMEAIDIASHMRMAPPLIGFTGGEPLLLGKGLRDVLDAYISLYPGIAIDVLTNGRLFSNQQLAKSILDGLSQTVTWMVPLYGHADFLHDFIVQSPGAFDQTINGLLSLQSYNQRIQLRIVLIEPTAKILPDLCEFIGRNFPFVREVAIMGCEPVGFARANKDVCQIDPVNYERELNSAIRWLTRFNIDCVLMNLPLCGLPENLWGYAHQSISDWKQAFAPECDDCLVMERCCGVFSWYEKGWRPTAIRPVGG